MFAKSLQILVLTTLLALAAVITYASLELTGPDEALAEAQALADRDQLARAISLLNITERDVRGDAARSERLWRLRADLATKLGQNAAALEDVRRLMRALPDDDELPLDEVRLLALGGDGAGALRAAEQFLAKHPTHGRGLELAGEASQTLYQPRLRETMVRLERELPLLDRPAGREAAWSFLYRPAQDPGIEAARVHLAALHADDPRLQTAWPPLEQQLVALRELVQRSLDYYRGSLEAPGWPVAAFRAVALALDQSRRTDDLLAQCEIMRRRFTHKYVADAGAAAAWSLLRDGQDAAALATTWRWLGDDPLPVPRPFPGLTDGQVDLLVARSLAGFRINDMAAVQQGMRDSTGLAKVLPYSTLVIPLSQGLAAAKNSAWIYASSFLQYSATLLMKQPRAVDRLDMLPEVALAALDAMRNHGMPEPDLQSLTTQWQRARPGTIEPLQANAAMQSAMGRPRGAAAALREALAIDPANDALFANFLAAMREQARDVGPDGAALMQQCVARRSKLPEMSDPTGYILCAEAALAANAQALARDCALAAINAFPQARTPHELALRVQLASDAPEEAVKAADRLLAGWPPDRAGVALALQAYAAAKRSPVALLTRALTASPSPELQAALLTQALADAPTTAASFAGPVLRDPAAPPASRLLAARALIASATAADARPLLDDAVTAPAACSDEFTEAVAAWLTAMAKTTTDDALLAAFQAWQPGLAASTPITDGLLPALAATLAATHPRAAQSVAEHAVANTRPERRTGRLFALAGRCAARIGDLRVAEERLTAALAFADGQECAEDLARLCLCTGRPDRAQEVRDVVVAPRALGLALRFDPPAAITKLVAARLTEDPTDLAAHATMAALGEGSMSDWPRLTIAVLPTFAEVLALAEDGLLAPLAVERLSALVAAAPEVMTNRLLLARALAHAGRGAEAAQRHRELVTKGAASPLVWREVARLADQPGYTLADDVGAAFVKALLAGELAGVPATERVAALLLLRRGLPADLPAATLARVVAALATLPATRWLAADEVTLLADRLPPDAGVATLAAVLATPQPEPVRQLAVTRSVDLCERLLQSPTTAVAALAAMRARLAADLAAGAVNGRVLRFVATADPTLMASDGAKWLVAHMDAIAAGRDTPTEMTTTVTALAALVGATDAQAAVEAALQRHPTALPLWQVRTEVAAARGDARAEVRDLGAVLAHCDAPTLRLLQVTLAAEARLAGVAEAAVLAALPPELRDGPLGRYTQGVLMLRMGRPDDAVPLLADAPARPDGMHLFARGLAALQSRAADGTQQARAAFERLQRDYPSSSLARNAGRFANQLALP